MPVETSRLVIQKRPRLDSSLWKPRARFWVYDADGNRLIGAEISASVTYLRQDGSVHAVVDGACTTSAPSDRCNINIGLYVSRDITTVWNVSVLASPEWDGSNAEFYMDWES